MTEARQLQVAFMPWASLGPEDRVAWNGVVLAPWETVGKSVDDGALRSHLNSLMRMYRSSASTEWGGVQKGIGILSVGELTFAPLSPGQTTAIQDFRSGLFLAALSSAVHRAGPDSGHLISTSENFSLVFQNFQVGQDRLSEESGTIIRLVSMGYRINSTRFVKPGYVPTPMSFKYDEALLRSFDVLRRGNSRLVRRILRAAATFYESFYNSPALDVNARILLQASAFETHLDLPEKGPREAFKDRVEMYCARPGDRRIAYKYSAWGQKRQESRTVFGLWADRFYQLRNHIVHGERLRRSEYVFRGSQHHVLIAAHVFVACIKALVNDAHAERGCKRPHSDRVFWRKTEEGEEVSKGFRTEVDWAAKFGYR